MSRIDEIEARCKKAFQGPWVVSHKHNILHLGPVWKTTIAENIEMPEDVEFIANARQDIPWLLERVQNLEADLMKYKQCTDVLCAHCHDVDRER